MTKISRFLNWLDYSPVGAALFLLLMVACFLLFWVATPTGFDRNRNRNHDDGGTPHELHLESRP